MTPELILDKLLYGSKYLSLWERTNDKSGSYFMAVRGHRPPPAPEHKRPDAVVIVAILKNPDEEPRLVLIDEYRIPIGCREIAFPAGLIDCTDYSGLWTEPCPHEIIQEAAEKAAIRELKEETGLNFIPLHSSPYNLYSSAGMTNESCIIVFGEAIGTPTSEFNEGTEDIRVMPVTFREMLGLLDQNRAFSKAAWPLLWAFKMMGQFKIENNIPRSGDGWAGVSPKANWWNTNTPPNETLVEVELDGEIIQVMAFFGREGHRPHWRTEDGSKCWSTDTFSRWRAVFPTQATAIE
jgi:ADP-ribose pyrophosphatase